MIEAAWLAVGHGDTTLPDAVAMITDRAARMAGFTDRGRIEAGLRADLVQVRPHEGHAIVRKVWRAGERVA
jgi:alpha-D-ribose 1-methylphosphonate 5-triphosphate diphosphatase